jgi:hypothetical protein
MSLVLDAFLVDTIGVVTTLLFMMTGVSIVFLVTIIVSLSAFVQQFILRK